MATLTLKALMTPRPHLLAASALLLAALAGPARGQYVEDSIDVGGAWVGSLAYNSSANVIYGASGDGLLFTISCDSNRLIRSVPLGGARRVVYNSLDNRAYCTADGGGGTVAVIDGSTHEVIRSIPMVGSTSIEWDSVANRIYVANDEAGNVGVIDCRTDSVIAMIPVPGDAWQLDMNAPGRKLYVRNYYAESVTIINMDLNAVIRTLPVGSIPQSGSYCPTQNKYYCVPLGEAVVVDGASDSIIRRVRLPGTPPALFHDMIWVPSSDLMMTCGDHGTSTDSVAVLDPSTDSLVAVLAVQGLPRTMLWGPTPGHVLCANAASNSVSFISADGLHVEMTVPVGWYPFTMAASPRNGRAYVGCLGSRRVYVICDTAAAVAEEPTSVVRSFSMLASPNPFRASVEFSGSSESDPPAELCVFSRTGERVAMLHPAETGAGRWRSVWDGRDDLGRAVPAGVYFVRSLGLAPCSVLKTTASR
jgi:YVTN family beta-propeller protein